MVNKLDQQTYKNEFEFHRVPHSCGLVPHLSKKLKKLPSLLVKKIVALNILLKYLLTLIAKNIGEVQRKISINWSPMKGDFQLIWKLDIYKIMITITIICGNSEKRKCLVYDTKLHPVVRFQFWKSRVRGAILSLSFLSSPLSSAVVLLVRVPTMDQIELF